MKLVVNELMTELGQTFTSDHPAIVEAVRLHLYKHNYPTGNVFVEIRDSNNEVISTSEEIQISSISSEAFFHGKVRFYINAYLAEGIEYKLVLRSSGYTFGESSYIGWCIDFDKADYPVNFNALGATYAAQSFEIWERN